MKIGIDIDDTLTNTKELQKEVWKKYYLDNPEEGYSEEIPNNINTFGFPYIEKYWDIYREDLFYPTFKKNASKIVKQLKKDGHELCVITSRPSYKYKDLHKRLHKWFEENDIPIETLCTNIKNKGHYCKKKNINLLIDNDIAHFELASFIILLWNSSINSSKVTSNGSNTSSGSNFCLPVLTQLVAI